MNSYHTNFKMKRNKKKSKNKTVVKILEDYDTYCDSIPGVSDLVNFTREWRRGTYIYLNNYFFAKLNIFSFR